MIKPKFSHFLIALCVIVGQFANAQSFKSSLEIADEAYGIGNYYTAQEFYLKVFDELKEPEAVSYPYGAPTPLKKNEEFDTYKYVMQRLASSYFNYKDYPNAEIWFAKINSLQEFVDIDNMVNYGFTLRANEKYEASIIEFKKAKAKHQAKYIKTAEGKMVESEETKAVSEKIDFELKCSEFAMKATTSSSSVIPELLDTIALNTKDASNYAGTLMDMERLMFTTTRFVNKNPSSKKKGAWQNTIMTYNLIDSSLKKIEFGFGLDRQAAAPSITAKGDMLFITSWSTETEQPVYEILMSRPLNDSIWEAPKKLNDIVNLPGTNSKHAMVARDGSGIYFASDRKEGLGGFDIYYVRLNEDGQPYGRAVNLGENINTVRNDEAPFYDQLTQTLYYSTDGKIGMGGLDVFTSERQQNNWTPSSNMGFPVNSSKDDSYFVVTDNDNIGYLSSDRGNSCCYKLYTFEVAYYYAGGIVLDAVDDALLENVRVTLLDSTGKNEVAVTYTDESGYYALPIVKGQDYKVEYSRENFLDDEQTFAAINLRANDTLPLPEIKLITTEIGRAVNLENVFYDFGKATLRPESKEVILKLVRQLKKYPYLVMEIGSHTDDVGSDANNIRLSNARSQSVVDFMISSGIPKDMIEARGYGESVPKVPNANPDGSDNPANRQINRRTEFKVLRYNFDKK